MMFVGAYESYGLSLNWTKVGLKDHRGRVGYSILIRLNWTKVGLKDGNVWKFVIGANCLNWTKVGLKGRISSSTGPPAGV